MDKKTAQNFTVVFASTSGNVAAVVDSVLEDLTAAGIKFTSHRAETADPALLDLNQDFILATSTWEHGRINPYFDSFLAAMQQKNLEGKRAAFIGLGDRRYEPVLFCQGIEILKAAFLQQGGVELFETLKIDGEPQDLLEELVQPWTHNLMNSLRS